MKRAVREHLSEFLAILALLAFALLSTAVILAHQRASLPSWVPLFGTDHFELKAEFTSAQAVTPGQGQTVTIAGINVGDISGVELDGGEAVVTMQLDNKYAELIHPDATLLLRPRTGLQDMTLALDPGTQGAPVSEGWTVPQAQTQPNVQPDQFLATLDGDTRDFLTLLLQGGAKGFYGHGRQLSSGLRRLEPFSRDLAEINGALAKRRDNIRQVIHNFGLLSDEIARHDKELANFVTSSNSVFAAFGRQADSLRALLQQAPSALRATQGALQSNDALSLALKPALLGQNGQPGLIRAAQVLKPALEQVQPFFRKTTAPIRNQIRPFTHQVRKPIHHLAQASKPLPKAATALTGAFTGLNQLFNELTYDPPGSGSSFLFFLSWLGHDTNSLFTFQDANGPLPRGLLLQTCGAANLAEVVTAGKPFLKTLLQLANPSTHAEIQANGGC
jgi:phospholipid/cholesterol/gamma-HCH transport system substrate-binding protein